MTDRAERRQTTHTDSVSVTNGASTAASGSGIDLTNLSWSDVLKQGVYAIVTKGGPVLILLALVLGGIGWMADKHLTNYFDQQSVVVNSYADYVKQSKESDALLTKAVAKLGEAVELNTKRLDLQEDSLRSMKELIAQNGQKIDTDIMMSKQFASEGSVPAKRTAALMEEALKRHAEADDDRRAMRGVWEEIRDAVRAHPKPVGEGAAWPMRRADGGEEKGNTKNVAGDNSKWDR